MLVGYGDIRLAFDGHDDALNRQTQVTDPRGSITKTEYDEAGNVKKITAPGNFGTSIVNLTEYTYDDLNRLKTEKKTNLPGSPTATNVYDARGNLVSQTNLKGQATAFVYDAFDRKLSENRPTDDGTVEKLRFGYEADDQIVYAENERTGDFWNSRSIDRYQYAADPLRRLKETNSTVIVSATSAPVTSTIVRSYVGGTNDLEKIDVSGNNMASYTVDYTYDALGRMIGEDLTGTGVNAQSASFVWNAAGQLQWIQRASGANKLDTVYGYDLAGRLTSLRHETPGAFGPTSQGAYQYQYDAVDRITWKQYLSTIGATSQIDKYSYDQADQLVSAAHDYQAHEAYVYDANGNRTGGGQTYSQHYNRLTADGTFTYGYDNEGNLLTKTRISSAYAADKTVVYTYDARNRLIFVEQKDNNNAVTMSASYVYDSFDRRVAKIVDLDGAGTTYSATTELYTYDGDDLLLTRSATGAVQHRYLNGPLVDQVLVDDKLSGTPAVRWLLADEQQTARKLLQPGVTPPLAEFTYNSFGKLTSATTPAQVDLLFGHAGGQYDAETGLTRRGRRYYQPDTGRFQTEDPAEADVNPYRYAGNSPTNFTDPSGMSWLSEIGKSVNHFVQNNGGWGTWAIAAAFIPAISWGALSFGVQSVAGDPGLGFTYDFGSGTNTAIGQSVVAAQGDQSLGVNRAGVVGALGEVQPAGFSSYGGGIQFTDLYAFDSGSVFQAPVVAWLPGLSAYDQSMLYIPPFEWHSETQAYAPLSGYEGNPLFVNSDLVRNLRGPTSSPAIAAPSSIAPSGITPSLRSQANANIDQNLSGLANVNTGYNFIDVSASFVGSIVGNVVGGISKTAIGVLTSFRDDTKAERVETILQRQRVMGQTNLNTWQAGVNLYAAGTTDQIAYGITGFDPNQNRALSASERAQRIGEGMSAYASTFIPLAKAVSPVAAASSIKFGPHVEGPLPSKVANTFRGGSYSQITLEADTTLYRTYGGTSGQMGSYWSRTAPSGSLQARMDLALPPGNTATNVIRMTVPKGSVIYEGAAGPNFGQLGGGNQVFIPKVNPGWVNP